MKLLTLQFLTCALKTCKLHPSSSFPLHPTSCTLSRTPTPFSSQFLSNLLPRLDLPALRTIAVELGLEMMMPQVEDLEQKEIKAEGDADGGKREEAFRKLHALVMETEIQEGKLRCGNCGFEYGVKEGVGNFLLPPHLV